MPSAVVEGLFLFAFGAPLLTIAACALALLVTPSSAPRSGAAANAPPLTH